MFYKVLEFTLSMALYTVMPRLTFFLKKKKVWFFYIFIICMAALGLSCSTGDLHCHMQDLLLWLTGSLVVVPGLRSCGAQA